ncbi:MAG: TSUP family transporter [Magnetococcus sp. WYHC-3]
MALQTKPTLNVPFCRQSWRAPAVVLALACLATFAWGIHLLRDHQQDLRGVSYIVGVNQPTPAAMAAPVATEVAPAGVPAAAAGPASTLVRASLVGIAVRGAERGSVLRPAGSGVLIHSSGYVATAAHFLDGNKGIEVTVSMPGGVRTYQGQLVKAVPEHDLAVVKLISRESFPYLSPTDSRAYPAGMRVIAWGDQQNRQVIAQPGVVDGAPITLNVGGTAFQGLVPTAAVYHWAQSGGPLVDAQGTLLGINLMLQDGSGQTRGFAVPAYLIRAHFRDIMDLAPPDPPLAPPQAGWQGMPPQGVSAGADPQGGPAFATPEPVMTAVALQSPVPASGVSPLQPAPASPAAMAQGPPAPDPSRRPADDWWDRARASLHDTLNLHLPAAPFDISWLSSPDAPHSQQNQIFGYPARTFLGLIFLGLISGISGGMMTMGGGIIKVTGLMEVFGYGLVLVRPVAYLTNIFMYGAASLRYKRDRLLDWSAVRPMVPWALAGMVAGYGVGTILDTDIIRILLGLFALALGARMVQEIYQHHRHPARHGGVDGEAGQPGASRHALVRMGILGLPMGLISGVLGITGGVVEVPLQRYINKVPLRVAIANSAVLVFFASIVGSVVALAHGLHAGAFDATTPLVMAMILLPGAYAGGMLGAWLTTVVPMDLLRWVYAALMFLVAGRMLLA